MPLLGDYLGHLLSEITNARVHADLETLRIAEFYAGHPLLKHLPIPRFRLPTVDLDVPVAIRGLATSTVEPPRSRINFFAVRKTFDQLYSAHMKRFGFKLSNEDSERLTQSLDRTIADLKDPPDVPVSAAHIADGLVFNVIEALRKPPPERAAAETPRLDVFEEELKSSAREKIAMLTRSPERLEVQVATAEMKEVGSKDFLAILHLSISEDAFEWREIEVDGKTQSRLIPE
ncbi:MAG: hypothetical protein HY033_05520 [Ignavibacteriae bacterium]|nr:hypothetical protein [Ignavibacteria bacterium]MBI3364348.1 hypothetical protein [Ignavibacteriota bacterium]